ncbi:unnamed protein product [Rodentolepis nana]|uniref:D-aminoacyl-tRNA deacylase n=1 Tax=Rodentolepis nana TaxID=102285 RepID=A0A0R3TXP6_RODNA|nr:unnamed protein product [Rodentolepis nana]
MDDFQPVPNPYVNGDSRGGSKQLPLITFGAEFSLMMMMTMLLVELNEELQLMLAQQQQRTTVFREISIDGELVSEIGRGLMVLVGISHDDEEKDLVYMARKIVNLRIFDDQAKQKRWDKSIKDVDGEVLCVSQVLFP